MREDDYGRNNWKYVLADKSWVGHDRGMTKRDGAALRDVVILVYPEGQSLDFIGPLEVFAAAQTLIAATGRTEPGYRITVAGLDEACRPIVCSSGVQIVPATSLAGAPRPIDTLIVPGGAGSAGVSSEEALLDWLRETAPSTRRVASVCTGAFVLAAAGLLDGRRATTHWASAARLAKQYPAVEVDPDPIYLRDGPIWTSAGVTAGMDLALALVEEDLDREAALTIARHLVLFLRRPGNQSQFSATLAAQQPEREPLREVQRYVVEHVAEDLTVEALAEQAHMSQRHFARAFRAETGITPGRYVERVRVEAARRALEDSVQPIATIAAACGFGTPETMRRAFIRALGVAPAEYRRRYHPDGAPSDALAA